MTLGSILGYVAFVISIVSAILAVCQSNELLKTKAELRKARDDREWWRDRAVKHLREVVIKEQHISRLEKRIEALEGEVKLDERGDGGNSCCCKCIYPSFFREMSAAGKQAIMDLWASEEADLYCKLKGGVQK